MTYFFKAKKTYRLRGRNKISWSRRIAVIIFSATYSGSKTGSRRDHLKEKVFSYNKFLWIHKEDKSITFHVSAKMNSKLPRTLSLR